MLDKNYQLVPTGNWESQSWLKTQSWCIFPAMNEYYYNSRQVAALFGVALETIRNWGSEFREYLSPLANPGQGKHRKYNPDDLAVFALVRDLKEKGLGYTDVHLALQTGERGQPPGLAPNQVQAIVVGERERRLALEVQTLQASITQLQARLAEAEAAQREAAELQRKSIVLETRLEERQHYHETRINELSLQLEEARRRIEELLEESGKQYSRGMMDALERQGIWGKKTNNVE